MLAAARGAVPEPMYVIWGGDTVPQNPFLTDISTI